MVVTLLACLLEIVVIGPQPAPARQANDEAFVYKIVRQDPKAPPLDASITVEWKGDGESHWVVTLDRRRTHYRLLTAMYAETGVDLYPRVFVDGVTPPPCPTGPLCGFPLNDPITMPISQDGDPDFAFVAAVGLDPKIDITSAGWKVEPLDPTLMQVVTESDAGSAGIRFTGNYSASRFTGAELEGGPFGSLAFASIPCDPNQGVGEAKLSGGVEWPPKLASLEFFCARPDLSYYIQGLASAPGATRWTFEGDVVGSGAFFDTRLSVFSFPDLKLPVRRSPAT